MVRLIFRVFTPGLRLKREPKGGCLNGDWHKQGVGGKVRRRACEYLSWLKNPLPGGKRDDHLVVRILKNHYCNDSYEGNHCIGHI